MLCNVCAELFTGALGLSRRLKWTAMTRIDLRNNFRVFLFVLAVVTTCITFNRNLGTMDVVATTREQNLITSEVSLTQF